MAITEVCTGCGLCSQVCPQKCITMVPDEEGFLVPQIDVAVCINCGLCKKKCPQNTLAEKSKESTYYSAINADENDLLKSSSGGMFILLAKHMLSLGGSVCGCIYDENVVAKHVCTDDINTVCKMLGSKYVQSEAYQSYPEVNEALEADRYVMFTGTACQIAAIKVYLGKEYERLLTVDILCHGVPSPELFKKYVAYLGEKHRGKVTDISFRSKDRFGWGSEHRTRITLYDNKGKEKKYYPYMPAYFCAFFYGLNLRESCYQCKYAGAQRVSDVTIGDYWGYYQKYKRRFPEGISIISVNTEKGNSWIQGRLNECSFFEKLSEDEGKGSNTNFYHPTERYNARTGFYGGIATKSYSNFAKAIYFNKECRKRLIRTFLGAVKCRIKKRLDY